MKNTNVIFLLAALCFCATAPAQKKIVVLGSSTAEGIGAWPDSAWVKRMQVAYNRNTTDGIDTTVINLAKGGTTTYFAMPTGYSVPNRPAPNPDSNVTKAIALGANAVIINFPSNDIASGIPKAEIMHNYRTMFQTLNNAGVRAYITTTQPRFLNATANQFQRDLVDSITNAFGAYSINFWDDLVSNDGQNVLRPEVNYGDGIHVNNFGHRLLFQRVMARNIFAVAAPLPLKLKGFSGRNAGGKVELQWQTEDEDPGTTFELQRSTNGRDFNTLEVRNGNGGGQYKAVDAAPLPGRDFYRLQITEGNKKTVSNTVVVNCGAKGVAIDRLRLTSSGLSADLLLDRSQTLAVAVISASGAVVYRQSQKGAAGVTTLSIPLLQVAAGSYFLHVEGASAGDKKAFQKLN